MTDSEPTDAVASSFPRPPRTIDDATGRTIEFRTTDGADPAPVVEMYDEFDPVDRAQGIPPSQTDQIRSWLGDLLEEGLNVLAWADDAVVGHAVLMPDDDGSWELAIFVTQAYQGSGIGTELLRTLLGYGDSHGVDHVWLTVERWNRAAIALYEAVGFESTNADSFEMEMELDLTDSSS